MNQEGTPKKHPQKRPKKPLTRAQKKFRYDLRRYSILSALGLGAIGVLVLAIFLISLPFRLIFGGDDGQSSIVEPSSIVEVTPSPAVSTEPEPSTVTLMAVGDNLIHSTVFEYAQQEDGSYDFTDIYSYMLDDIQNADIACIQQETILITDPNEYTNYPSFGTPAEMADSLTEVGFDVICHASNHTYDKYMSGINDTIAAWKEHPEVTVLGIHESQEAADEIQIIEKNGIKIAMFNYTYGLNGYVPENDYTIDILLESNKERMEQMLQEAQEQSDIIVVFMHAGTEDFFTADETQRQWAQFFADNHVGLIIGTHSHTVQPTDEYTGKDGNIMPIFYSLGNFVSSQKDTQNMLGAMANVTITKDETGTYVSEYSLTPLVTWIQGGGTVGLGYRFHTLHLEDYTDEMGQEHIRDNCMPEDFHTLWNDILDIEDETEDSVNE